MIRTAEADAPPFPNVGSIAYLGGSAEKVKILQRNADGTALVTKAGPLSRFEGASRDRREPLANLFPDAHAALRFKASAPSLTKSPARRGGSAKRAAAQ